MTPGRWLGATLLAALLATPAMAASPPPQAADWVAHDFRFHTGVVVPELRLHYLTVGDPAGVPVLVLHGTAGSGASMMNPAFAGELFGPGQPLDAAKYFIILPDSLGAGGSAKPSDGLRARFPAYDYDDMVLAQYRLVTEGLGLRHLRLVLGNSMGGMQTWIWGESYPDFMDALVPMASQPTEMAARNWMLRRALIESIQRDPAYEGGNYATQPPSLRTASVLFGIASSGGTLGYQALAPTRGQADALVAERLAAPPPADANDFIYQWQASSDYAPAERLDRIRAPVLAINSADDERNPLETGVERRALEKVKSAQLYLVPASDETRGHATTGYARFWKQPFAAFMDALPQ